MLKDWLKQSRGIITCTCILDLQYILINLNNPRKSVKKYFERKIAKSGNKRPYFTNENLTTVPDCLSINDLYTVEEIFFDVEIVKTKIKNLKVISSSGPDEISSKFLTVHQDASHYHWIGSWKMLHLYLKKVLKTHQKIINLYLFLTSLFTIDRLFVCINSLTSLPFQLISLLFLGIPWLSLPTWALKSPANKVQYPCSWSLSSSVWIRNGLDRAVAAHALWERCAIPAILYCSEAMVLSKGVLKNLDSIQHMVARYILQLPKSSARISGLLDAGFMQMKDRVMTRTGTFVWNILKQDKILKAVFESVMRSLLDSWAKQVEALKEAWGGIIG